MRGSLDRATRSAPLLSLIIFFGLISAYAAYGSVTDFFFQQQQVCVPSEAYPCISDLALDKTDNRDPVTDETEFRYRIEITNDASTTGIEAVDELPQGVDFVSVQTEGGTGADCNYDPMEHTVTCTWGSVQEGELLRMVITVRAVEPGQWTNSASVTHEGIDPNPNNNSDDENTTIQNAPIVPPGGGGGGGDPSPSPSPSTSSPSPSPSSPSPSPSQSTSTPARACADGTDNDGDGRIDFSGGPNGEPSDPGCTSDTDDDEFNEPPPECSDGIDNDGDGEIDGGDGACDGSGDNAEGGVHPRCGLPGVICGTNGPDRLVGDDGPNEIYGGGGNDVCIGGGGNDLIVCGRGNDVIRGGPGNDRLSSTSGRDKIYGGRGRDVLKGRAGNDLLNGGRGRDRCQGGPGKDRLKSC